LAKAAQASKEFGYKIGHNLKIPDGLGVGI
jgi:hypothetical protein